MLAVLHGRVAADCAPADKITDHAWQNAEHREMKDRPRLHESEDGERGLFLGCDPLHTTPLHQQFYPSHKAYQANQQNQSNEYVDDNGN